MIRVVKRGVVPAKLMGLGQAENLTNQNLFDLNPVAYIAGAATFRIRTDIYNDPMVKKRLRRLQQNKCCFCEKDQTDEFAQVEHYRPKQGFNRFSGDPLQRPGYYWLSYSWPNLYFVCGLCNNAKSTAFYLEGEAQRAHNHLESFANERPLIINPGGDTDPRDHILFKKEVAVGSTLAGNTTIDVCKLNRESLLISRGKHLRDLKLLIQYVKKAQNENHPLVQKTKRKLKASMGKKAIFSAMVSDLISASRLTLD